MKKQLFYIVISSVMMIFVFLISKDKTAATPVVLNSEEREEEISLIEVEEVNSLFYFIDVKGEVLYPGVYEVSPEARVYEIIEIAGGFTNEANESAINLAEKIKDEMVIYIPHIEEEFNLQWQSEMTSDSKKISINRATELELQTLPGVGSIKAAAIIKYRLEVGEFKSIEEIKNVTGIGEKTFEGIQEFIEL